MNDRDQGRANLPAVQSDAANLMAVISKAATDPNVDVAKMERLFALYSEMDAKRAERDFAVALKKAQSEIPAIFKNKKADKNTYANLEQVNDVVVPISTANGFALSFGNEDSPIDKHYRIVCFLSHEGGYTRKYHADIPADHSGSKNPTQGFGSTISYGRRYLTLMIFNVSTTDDDDDANGGVAKHAPAQPKMSEGAMKARQWMSNAVHDLEGFTAADELENWLTDMRGHCLRICRDYRPIWIAPNFSGLRDRIMEGARRCAIVSETQNYIDKIEAEAADTQLSGAA